MIKHCGGKQTHKAEPVKATHSTTQQKDKWIIVEKKKEKKNDVPLSDSGCLRKSALFESCYLKASPPPLVVLELESDCCPWPCQGQFWMGARPFICSPQGCSYFHVGDPSTFCCRWPRPPSFLSMAKKKRPPGSIEGQWKASDSSLLQTRDIMLKGIEKCYESWDVSAAWLWQAQLWSRKSFSSPFTKEWDTQTAYTNVTMVQLLWDNQYWLVRADWR